MHNSCRVGQCCKAIFVQIGFSNTYNMIQLTVIGQIRIIICLCRIFFYHFDDLSRQWNRHCNPYWQNCIRNISQISKSNQFCALPMKQVYELFLENTDTFHQNPSLRWST